MENTGVDLLAGIGIALYLGVTFVKWAYQEIVIVLAGITAIGSHLSMSTVILAFVVYPPLIAVWLAGFIFRKYLIRTV